VWAEVWRADRDAARAVELSRAYASLAICAGSTSPDRLLLPAPARRRLSGDPASTGARSPGAGLREPPTASLSSAWLG
jgi:hypothetical protein